MSEYTIEQLEKARKAQTHEELIIIAREAGVELDEEDAKGFFLEIANDGGIKDLAADELENVTGGYCHDKKGREIVTLITECMHPDMPQTRVPETPDVPAHYDRKCSWTDPVTKSKNCHLLTYEKGIWYCNHCLRS